MNPQPYTTMTHPGAPYIVLISLVVLAIGFCAHSRGTSVSDRLTSGVTAGIVTALILGAVILVLLSYQEP